MSHTEFTSEELHALDEASSWPRFLLFPGLAVSGYVCFVCRLGGDSLAVQTAWILFVGYCCFCVGGVLHETVHQTLGSRRWANLWGGRLVGTLLFIPYSVYRETHIRHHAYMNTPEDWELWPYACPHASLGFRRAFAWFDIFGAALSAPIIYGRIYFSRNSPLSRQARATITREYVALAAFWGVAAMIVMGLAMLNGVQLRRFDPVWLLPLPVAGAFNTLRKFTEHLGMASYDPILGTRTVIGSNWITRWCSYFNFELFVHGPHHRFPRAPHNQLSARLNEYQRQRPDIVVPLFSTYFAALFDMLPCLLRNPGIGVNVGGEVRYRHKRGVENFASEVDVPMTDNELRHVA